MLKLNVTKPHRHSAKQSHNKLSMYPLVWN